MEIELSQVVLFYFIFRARLLKPYAGSRKMSPRGTPLKTRDKCRELHENKLEKIDDPEIVPDNNETSV